MASEQKLRIAVGDGYGTEMDCDAFCEIRDEQKPEKRQKWTRLCEWS
jgi:hypothetical protein